MKYKILIPNKDGKFVYTKEELEKILEEVYNEGYNEGMQLTITTPSYPPNPITHPYVTWSDTTIPKVKISCDDLVEYYTTDGFNDDLIHNYEFNLDPGDESL